VRQDDDDDEHEENKGEESGGEREGHGPEHVSGENRLGLEVLGRQ